MVSQFRELEYRRLINRIGWSLVIMIGAMNVIGIINVMLYGVIGVFGSDQVSISLGAIVDSVCYLSFFLIPSWLFYVMSKKIQVEEIKFKPNFSKHLPLMIVAGIGISFGAAIINDWFCTIINYSLPSDDIPYYISNPETVALFMTISLAPAFAEELLFRGVIYSNLRPYGKTPAILISALAFGLMHTNVGQFLYTTVAGICLALIYEETKSIWGCIFMHMFNNFFSVFASTVMYRYNETMAMMIIYLVQAAMIFAGAICLIALICIKKKSHREAESREVFSPPQGHFRVERSSEYRDADVLSTADAIRIAIKTPGIIVFLILSILTTLLLILLYSGGGAV